MNSMDYSQGLKLIMFLPPCLLSMLSHLGENWSRQRTLSCPESLSPAGVKCSAETGGPNNPDEMSHVQNTSPLCCAEDLFTSRSGYTCGESCETKEMTWNSMLWHRCERGCSHDLFLSSPSFLSLFSVVSDRLFPGNKIKCKYLQQLMHFSQKSSYQYSRVHRLHIVHHASARVPQTGFTT